MGLKKEKKDFGYLGEDFQKGLITQLLTDSKFANSIIDIIDPNYFNNKWLRLIMSIIIDNHEEYEIVPDVKSLEISLLSKSENLDEHSKVYLMEILREIKEHDLYNSILYQDLAMKFCKTQEMQKSINKVQKIIDTGDLDRFFECETIVRKALETGDNKDNAINVGDNIEEVLSDDFRNPIPTGIDGLDEIMNGGLSRQELGVILAPFGVGKTTLITKIANSAKNCGYNVLQIFFEDTEKVIQRKHFSCWSGVNLNDLSADKENITNIVRQRVNEPGELRLKKFSSDGVTIPMIKQYIRKLIASGFRPDLILLDYIDVVSPSRRYDDANVGEGSVMREFESMLVDLNLAGWTAVQGNRSSIGAELVEANQIGGSIKKGQIGHFILSIAKTLEQKEDGTAKLAILKSRFGKDGLVLDAIFDNGTVNIQIIDNAVSFLQSKNKQEQETIIDKKNKIKDLLSEYSMENLDNNTNYQNPLESLNN